MSFCPKCGNKVDDTMIFCPKCGTQLKDTAPSQAPPTPAIEPPQEQKEPVVGTKQEKNEAPKTVEKPKKAEYGFVWYLVAGLVLITIGVFLILELTNPALTPSQYLVGMLLTIGIIVINAAIYVALSGWKRVSSKTLVEPAGKQPVQPAL